MAPMRYCVAAILTVAAVLKMHETMVVGESGGVARFWYAFGPIAAELMLAGWLLSNLVPQPALAATAILFTAFACYSLVAIVRGQVSCGCFGLIHVPPLSLIHI